MHITQPLKQINKE